MFFRTLLIIFFKMAECPGIEDDPKNIYYKELILKKEGSRNWVEYYATLVNNVIIFNRKDSHTGHILPNNRTTLDITKRTICAYGEKKCYRFPFWIQTDKSKYYFKCETKLQRYKWMYAIRLCASGKPPEIIPNFIPTQNTTGRPRTRTSPSKRNLMRRPESVSSSAKQPTLKEPLQRNLSQINVSKKQILKTSGSQPTTTRSKSDLDTSAVLSATNGRKHRHRTAATGLESDKKTVKWDMRSAILSVLNKAVNSEGSSNSNKRDDSRIKHMQKNKELLKADVLENKCINNKNRKNSIADDNKSINQHKKENLKSLHVSADANLEPIEKSNSKTKRKDFELVEAICNKGYIEHDDLTDNNKKFNDIDEYVVDFNDDKLTFHSDFGELENLDKVPKEHDELESYATSSVIRYRIDGDIERFTTEEDNTTVKNNIFTAGVIISNRFGLMKKHSSGQITSDPMSQLQLNDACRAQSWTSLRRNISPQTTPPRREHSAPALRFSRYYKNDESEL